MMTREEIKKFLTNTKVYVNGKSQEIQEKLFSLGYMWNNESTNVGYIGDPFLFIYKDKSFTRSSDMVYFKNHGNREITADEILSIELTEPTYRPFKDVEECWNEMMKHEPFGWLKAKTSKSVVLIGNVYANEEVWIVLTTYERISCSASDLFNNHTFADDTPFGIKEE